MGAQVGSVLLAFGKSLPTTAAATPGGKELPVSSLISVGPCDNNAPGVTGDVEPCMAKALAAANYTRPRGTHLRVYRVPS